MNNGYISKFFKNTEGKIVVMQAPNFPVLAWLFLSIASQFVDSSFKGEMLYVSKVFLYIWAYLEIRYGVSPFRKALGCIVFSYLVVSEFF